MRFHIKPGDIVKYNAAFYDDQCVECSVEIEEGDPIGFLKVPNDSGRDGPFCIDCLEEVGTHSVITKH